MTRPAIWNSAEATRGALVCLAGELGVDLVDVEAAAATLTSCWDDGAPDHLAADLALQEGAFDVRQALAVSGRLQQEWAGLYDHHRQIERAIA